jgi:hypothetical protein
MSITLQITIGVLLWIIIGGVVALFLDPYRKPPFVVIPMILGAALLIGLVDYAVKFFRWLFRYRD